jgi:diguanylate cyclase (GGDEF)-like protein
MRASLARAGDMVSRIGGEEFAILLPATDEATALMLAQRVRLAVIDCAIPHEYSKAASVVTISIGLAVLAAGDAEDFDALFRRADQAMYRAKANGRNQVAGPIPIGHEQLNGEPK